MTESAAEWVSLDRLHGWDRNPKVHDEAQVADIVKSIRRFGWGAPILARKADGEVIAGHGRMAAAKALGMDRVPVRWLDLDPVDAHLLALADNRLVERSPWDNTMLAGVLRDLETEGADLDGLGWDEDSIRGLVDFALPFAPNALKLPSEGQIQDPSDAVAVVIVEVRIPPALAAEVLGALRTALAPYGGRGVVLNVA